MEVPHGFRGERCTLKSHLFMIVYERYVSPDNSLTFSPEWVGESGIRGVLYATVEGM